MGEVVLFVHICIVDWRLEWEVSWTLGVQA
jgi:hypothetical protein